MCIMERSSRPWIENVLDGADVHRLRGNAGTGQWDWRKEGGLRKTRKTRMFQFRYELFPSKGSEAHLPVWQCSEVGLCRPEALPSSAD